MVPKASVTPTAIRNSISPSCRALKDCSARNAIGMTAAAGVGARSALQWTGAVMRVLDVLLDDLEEFHIVFAVIGLFDPLQDDVLDRKIVVVELEVATQRLEVRLFQCSAELVGIFRSSFPQRGVEQKDGVILEHGELRRVAPVLLAEVGDEALVARRLHFRIPAIGGL